MTFWHQLLAALSRRRVADAVEVRHEGAFPPVNDYAKRGVAIEELKGKLATSQLEIMYLRRERDDQTGLAKQWLERFERVSEVARLRLEELDRVRAQLRARDGQIEDQAEQITALEIDRAEANAEVEELTHGIAAAREETRQERVARASAEQELAEANATIDGLGLKLGSYERAEAIADETRAKRYHDGLGDEQ